MKGSAFEHHQGLEQMDIIHSDGNIIAGCVRAKNDARTDQEVLFIGFHDGSGISTQLQTHTGEPSREVAHWLKIERQPICTRAAFAG